MTQCHSASQWPSRTWGRALSPTVAHLSLASLPPPSAWPWAPSTPRPISSTSFLVRAGPSKVSPGSTSSLQGARDIGGRHGSGRTKNWLFNHAVQTGPRPQAGGEGSLLGLPGRCPDFRSFKWSLGKERNKQVIRREGQKHSR